MSSEGSQLEKEKPEEGSAGGGSPGGKSLEVMQRRLKNTESPASQPSNQPSEQQPEQESQASGRSGKTAASLMATQAREQAAAAETTKQEQQPPASSAPGGKPKGKDFAAMAMNNPKPTIAAAPVAASPQASAGGKPKGKDFSAMANRMQSAPNPTQSEDEAQKLRARKMQAAARAAAGLPPLDYPTATSVTTVPPPISTPVKGQQSSLPTAGVSHHHSSMPDQRHHTHQQQQHHTHHQQQAYRSHQQQQQYQRPQQQYHSQHHTQPIQQHHQPAAVNRQSSASSRSRRPGEGTPAHSRSSSKGSSVSQNRLTPQPTEQEARVSSASKTTKSKTTPKGSSNSPKLSAASGGAHLAPLLGERVQDILNSIDPNYVIETEAEEQVLQLADDFLDKVINQSMRLAQHRGSKLLDVQDVQLILAKHWGIVVPGLGVPNIRPLKVGKQSSKSTGGTGSQANKRKPADSAAGGNSRKKPMASPSSIPQQMPTST